MNTVGTKTAEQSALEPESKPAPVADCPKCLQPAAFVRTRYFANQISHVFCCVTECCRDHGFYFHVDLKADGTPILRGKAQSRKQKAEKGEDWPGPQVEMVQTKPVARGNRFVARHCQVKGRRAFGKTAQEAALKCFLFFQDPIIQGPDKLGFWTAKQGQVVYTDGTQRTEAT